MMQTTNEQNHDVGILYWGTAVFGNTGYFWYLGGRFEFSPRIAKESPSFRSDTWGWYRFSVRYQMLVSKPDPTVSLNLKPIWIEKGVMWWVEPIWWSVWCWFVNWMHVNWNWLIFKNILENASITTFYCFKWMKNLIGQW